MRIQTDQELVLMGADKLLAILRASNYPVRDTEEALTNGQMQTIIATQQRQRSLAVWHDHSTILNNGVVMITVHVLYDTAVIQT